MSELDQDDGIKLMDRFFPDLKLSEADKGILALKMRKVALGANDKLMAPGEECRYLPLVLSGRIKVCLSSGDAREAVLYYMEAGDSCILSALGILNDNEYPAGAVCEEPGELLLVPSYLIREYVNRYESWRDFIFRLYNGRFQKLLELVDQVLFKNLDERLVRYLDDHSDLKGIIVKTHLNIAEDLGTSREVISRLLKEFERKGRLELQRGKILLSDSF